MIKHLFDFEMEYITYIIGIRRMQKSWIYLQRVIESGYIVKDIP